MARTEPPGLFGAICLAQTRPRPGRASTEQSPRETPGERDTGMSIPGFI